MPKQRLGRPSRRERIRTRETVCTRADAVARGGHLFPIHHLRNFVLHLVFDAPGVGIDGGLKGALLCLKVFDILQTGAWPPIVQRLTLPSVRHFV